ncbi:signal peptide peptidase SppA [Helicobacter mustelae]|uniref:Protease n=1 Tax=Helicobacter mustelae (strain ATCC 43772 / CCUG 25715 / CIP 103759 / LMG 18044 / NCTC 12198 / R85-136P) TaxID=679897 RepID=D3UH47_HELM1|nr:signal peptide peptidase SppA [Helicobacter mustelae]CBG39819.1 protease [Helicobacter mustelae 12198]SQH71328.1 protease [Helicobacter mustelae]STP12454.1 protease [Helicobacter mustelae]
MRTLANILLAPFAFITKYFKACIFLLIIVLLFFFLHNDGGQKNANLAKIYLHGPIIDSTSIYEQIKKIKANPNIKGALLLINSPGGAVSASVEISDMIRELNQRIPVVAYVQGVMASGSYYGGMYSKQIFANRGALIGSIGVIFSSMNIQNLMQKIGVSQQGVSAGAYKEVGTPLRKWTPEEYAYIKNLIQEEYQMFIDDVSDARKLDKHNYKSFAEGKIFTAKNAQKLGLIDEIGGMDDAIEALKNFSHVQDPIWLEKSKFDNYLERVVNSSTQVLFKNFAYQLQ